MHYPNFRFLALYPYLVQEGGCGNYQHLSDGLPALGNRRPILSTVLRQPAVIGPIRTDGRARPLLDNAALQPASFVAGGVRTRPAAQTHNTMLHWASREKAGDRSCRLPAQLSQPRIDTDVRAALRRRETGRDVTGRTGPVHGLGEDQIG
jgi:hypothetical protein